MSYMTSVETNETVKINRQVKAHLDAADRALMDMDTVKSSAELWSAARLAAVLTLKQRGLPHETDDEILTSIGILDDRGKRPRQNQPEVRRGEHISR